jgi:hyaluronoglucosaminidase
MGSDIELGIIEGYYGAPWTWGERADQVAFLAPHGYGFYLYAPKADPFLRRRWMEDYPAETAQALRAFARHCDAAGVRFGVGLSPYEIYKRFDAEDRAALARKLDFLDSIGVRDLAVLFDDMRGDQPDLARAQTDILHWVAERTKAGRLMVCPTYYSDDPVLDRVFGKRPEGCLEAFGALLDPKIEIIWTGEEVCSREYSPGHLERVAGQLGRKPFLWDNYPVNDGPRMSQFLHLRAFTGRPASIAGHLSAHGVNPALQPVLSRIPALTLAESYRLGEAYQYGEALKTAAEAVLGAELGRIVQGHLSALQDTGLDNLEPDSVERLRIRYAAFDHPGAREIVAWLDGAYHITREMIEAQ